MVSFSLKSVRLCLRNNPSIYPCYLGGRIALFLFVFLGGISLKTAFFLQLGSSTGAKSPSSFLYPACTFFWGFFLRVRNVKDTHCAQIVKWFNPQVQELLHKLPWRQWISPELSWAALSAFQQSGLKGKKRKEKIKVRVLPTPFFSQNWEHTVLLTKDFPQVHKHYHFLCSSLHWPRWWLVLCIYSTWPFSASLESKYRDSTLDIHTTLTLRGTTSSVFVLDIKKRTSWLNIAIQGEPAALCSK